MKNLIPALALVAAPLFSGCDATSALSRPTQATTYVTGMPGVQRQAPEQTGAVPFYLQRERHFRFATPPIVNSLTGPAYLAIADIGDSDVEILNSLFQLRNAFSIAGPDGAYYDAQRHLYITSVKSPGSVLEFSRTNAQIHSYSGVLDPVSVTGDSNDNIFVAGYDSGTIGEFKNGSSQPELTCSTGLYNEGIAVNSLTGAVFVVGNLTPSGPGRLVEYANGLKGCQETNLSPSFNFAGEVRIDSHANLVVADQLGAVIDIIAPPYETIQSTIPAQSSPFKLALNYKENQIYIVDASVDDVLISSYPGGKPLKVLSGFGSAIGVAAWRTQQ